MVRESFTSGYGLRRLPGHAFADELVAGMRIVPPGKQRPVTIERQLTENDGSAHTFEFACSSPWGWSALVLHRSAQVLVVPKLQPQQRNGQPE